MNRISSIIILGITCTYATISLSEEINVACKPDYILINGKFDHELSVENIYMRYYDMEILEIDAPFICNKHESTTDVEGNELVIHCKKGVFLTSVRINRKTGKYKRFSQLINSNPPKYEDVSGKCYRRGELF